LRKSRDLDRNGTAKTRHLSRNDAVEGTADFTAEDAENTEDAENVGPNKSPNGEYFSVFEFLSDPPRSLRPLRLNGTPQLHGYGLAPGGLPVVEFHGFHFNSTPPVRLARAISLKRQIPGTGVIPRRRSQGSVCLSFGFSIHAAAIACHPPRSFGHE
jgi:hypothetical protein